MSTGEAQPLHLLILIPQAKDVLSLPLVWLEFTSEEITPSYIRGILPPDPWAAGDTVCVCKNVRASSECNFRLSLGMCQTL